VSLSNAWPMRSSIRSVRSMGESDFDEIAFAARAMSRFMMSSILRSPVSADLRRVRAGTLLAAHRLSA
jgi:hypothetical protein